MDYARGEIELKDGVPLPKREPEIALAIEVEGAWAIQRGAGDGRGVGGGLLFPVAGEGGDRAGFHRHLAKAVIADVADEQIAGGVELDRVRLLHLGGGSGAAVTGK